MAVDAIGQTTGLRRSGRTRKPLKSCADEQVEDELARGAPPPKRKKKAQAVDAIEDEHSLEKAHVVEKSSDAETVKGSKKTSKSTASIEPKAKVTKRGKGKNAIGLGPVLPRPPGEKRPPVMYDLPKTTNAKRVAALPVQQLRAKAYIPRLLSGEPETRLKPFVFHPPDSYTRFLERANTQRMVVLERDRSVEQDCHANHLDCPREIVQIAGSKGNVYTVEISHTLHCNCPEAIWRRSTCKHILYILHQVLKAPEHLRYQNAFLTSELREIFEKAPPLPSVVADDTVKDGNRKDITEDCPICFTEMDEEEGIVWCRAACGNNIHKTCFDGWATAKAGNVTCPFCRSAWQYGEAPKRQVLMQTAVQMPAERGADGYFNVREQLGYD